MPVRKRAASGYETSSSCVRTGSQRHGKAINHNIGRASQRTHCRAARLIDRLTRPDLSPPPAAGQPQSRRRSRAAGRRTAERQCPLFSADASTPASVSNRLQRTKSCCAQLDATAAIHCRYWRHLVNHRVTSLRCRLSLKIYCS